MSLDDEKEYELILKESDAETYVEVPLVLYVGNERHVIGTATVKGSIVTASIGEDISEEVMDLLHLRPSEGQFSLGFNEVPDPFRRSTPPKILLPSDLNE